MTGRNRFTAVERDFLTNPPRALARIATIDEQGMPHVVPAGWVYDAEAEELVLGGRSVGRTQRASHVRRHGVAAVVVDGIAGPGWSPWALMVRGTARYSPAEDAIRVSCDNITSWGLEAAVTGATR